MSRATLRAVWNGVVLAESSETVRVEGNHYFPRDSVRLDHLVASSSHTLCPWKGLASYYSVIANGQRNENAAWYYPHPSPLARRVKDCIAFWNGVEVVEDNDSR